MTPIERYRHLMEHWKCRIDDANKELEEAQAEYRKWYNKLVFAEIAEKLAAEE